ncbi:hypothetical protein CSUI_009658, partial [Cystoisospora suis]
MHACGACLCLSICLDVYTPVGQIASYNPPAPFIYLSRHAEVRGDTSYSHSFPKTFTDEQFLRHLLHQKYVR